MKIIATPNAPEAIGPYSQAVVSGGVVYCSGQIALDPKTMTLIEGDAAAQTQQIFKNMSAVLDAAGVSLSQVVKTTVFLQDMADFAEVNRVYASCFNGHMPARATVEVAKLPAGARVEIEAIACAATA
jgi:2-iminobutanoate/2-iminopropanoate deaminase